MRIAMIGQKGLPAHSGGVERHVEDLATRLAAAEHEVFVYARVQYGEQYGCPKKFKGTHLIYLPTVSQKNIETPLHTLLASIHALFQKIDIIHYHGIGPALFCWIPRLCAPRIKVVATFHCQDYYHQKWGILARIAFRIGEFAACRIAHQTIVVSRHLQAYVKERHGREAVYLPNAVARTTNMRADAITQTWGLTKHSYILSVSRLVRHKGIHHLVDAYLNLSKIRPTLPKLVIVGSASYTSDYVRDLQERAAGNQNILFVGEQSGSVLAELYSNARLFVQSSESEGLSYTLLEALGYGVPVVVSDIVENREVIPWAGFLFKSGDSADLALRMEAALCAGEAYAAYVCQQHVFKHYNLDTVFPQVLQEYARLATT